MPPFREWFYRALTVTFVFIALVSLAWMFLVSAPTKNPNWAASVSRIFFSDLYVETWRDWLNQFQSLIGGVLAVTAAGATVMQMRITERKSDERHTQLVRLQTRADALRVDRMIYGNKNIIKAERAVLRTVLDTAKLTRPYPEFEEDDFAQFHRIETACARALSAISNDEWSHARDLFQGSFLEVARRTITYLDSLRDKTSSFWQLTKDPAYIRVNVRNEIFIETGRVIDSLDELISEIEKMERLYFLDA
ncbi:hypothetical protein A6U97_12135 [Agrobacterium tumefaciens]|nr:hypothetical protein A6U97_12135 [Agrobacterium tumefaciens]